MDVRESDHKEGRVWRTDVFKLWCCRRLLRIPWTSRRSNQSILKETNPEYSLDRLRLKLQYFGHLMQRVNSWERTLMLGKTEDRRTRRGDRGWDGWMISPVQRTWVWTNSRRWWRKGKPGVLQSMGMQRVGYDLATEQQKQQIPYQEKINITFHKYE